MVHWRECQGLPPPKDVAKCGYKSKSRGMLVADRLRAKSRANYEKWRSKCNSVSSFCDPDFTKFQKVSSGCTILRSAFPCKVCGGGEDADRREEEALLEAHLWQVVRPALAEVS